MLHLAGLVIAGVLAAIVGTAGGITTVISYPALLWAGLAPLPASIANTVAVVACLPGSALASRPELARRRPGLGGLTLLTAGGGVAGALLLVATPAHAFGRIVVPLLVLAAAALLFQPRITRWEQRRRWRASQRFLPAGVLLAGLYNAYFGAGSGVLLLVMLLLPGEDELPVANAVKNILVGVGAVISATVFVVVSRVAWAQVLPLGLGLFVGSLLGPRLTRRAPGTVVRVCVAALAVGLAVALWVAPGA